MKRKTRIQVILATVTVLVAALVGILVLNGRGKAVQKTEMTEKRAKRKAYLVQKNAAVSAVKYPSASTGSKGDANSRNKEKAGKGLRIGSDHDGTYRDSDGNPYPDADQKIMAAADAAIDEDDVEMARSLAGKALASDNKELKELVVDALGWFGEATMSELTPFMSDPDEEIAEKAASHWKDALQEISDDGMKAGVVELSLTALKNKDLLEDVANELIGIDELAALQVIANVMERGDGSAAEALRDVYDSITGEKWTGIDAAEKWLQENYTPPDKEDDDDKDD